MSDQRIKYCFYSFTFSVDEFSKMSSEEALQEDNGGSLFCFTEDEGTCTEFK